MALATQGLSVVRQAYGPELRASRSRYGLPTMSVFSTKLGSGGFGIITTSLFPCNGLPGMARLPHGLIGMKDLPFIAPNARVPVDGSGRNHGG